MDSGSDAGASLWSLQPVARPAECALETGGKAEGMESSRSRHMQVSELFSMEACDQAVVVYLVATEVGTFPPM